MSECVVSVFAVFALIVAWIEIRFLREMLSINKDYTSAIERILDRLIRRLQGRTRL